MENFAFFLVTNQSHLMYENCMLKAPHYAPLLLHPSTPRPPPSPPPPLCHPWQAQSNVSQVATEGPHGPIQTDDGKQTLCLSALPEAD